MGTNETFDPPIQLLRDSIAKTRLASRKSVEKAINHRSGPPLNLVEYKPGLQQDYSSPHYTPLKVGDLFLLNMAWDKNNSTPYYVVSKVPEVPDGVNFDDRLVGARKVGVKKTSANQYYFSFDAIRLVLDGNTSEAKDFLLNANSKTQPALIRRIFEEGYPIRLKPNTDLYSPEITWDDFLHVDEEFESSLTSPTTPAPKNIPRTPRAESSMMTNNAHLQKARHQRAKRPVSRTVTFRNTKKRKIEKTANSRENLSRTSEISQTPPLPENYVSGNNLSTDNLVFPEYTGPRTRSRTRDMLYM